MDPIWGIPQAPIFFVAGCWFLFPCGGASSVGSIKERANDNNRGSWTVERYGGCCWNDRGELSHVKNEWGRSS